MTGGSELSTALASSQPSIFYSRGLTATAGLDPAGTAQFCVQTRVPLSGLQSLSRPPGDARRPAAWPAVPAKTHPRLVGCPGPPLAASLPPSLPVRGVRAVGRQQPCRARGRGGAAASCCPAPRRASPQAAGTRGQGGRCACGAPGPVFPALVPCACPATSPPPTLCLLPRVRSLDLAQTVTPSSLPPLQLQG